MLSNASQADIAVPRASAAARAAYGLFRVLSVIALFAMLFGGFAARPDTASAASGRTTSALNLRSGPSTDYRVILVIPNGASITVDGDPRGGFYPVSYSRQSGYAAAQYISLGGATSGGGTSGGSASATGSAAVTSALNLRAGPSTGDRVLTVMPSGVSVTLNGRESNGFLSITYRGTSGWAYSQYLRRGGSAPSSGSDDGGSVAVGNTVTGSRTVSSALNLRTGPGTGYRVIVVMRAGAMVEVMGSARNGFLPVRFQGTKGWASTSYLSTSGGGTDGGSNSGSSDIVSIIYAAADRYGQSREAMLRVAKCESNLNPMAKNRSSGASGLFQFMPGTWQTTPFRDQDIFSATASANAAGWMWANGRRNEWSCQ